MLKTPAPVEVLRQDAALVLAAVGVSRIIVVDDEYADRQLEVEELIGLCSAIPPGRLAGLPFLEGVAFEADREIWVHRLRDVWQTLDASRRAEVVERARALEAESDPAPLGESSEEGAQASVAPSDAEGRATPAIAESGEGTEPASQDDPAPPVVDIRAARVLEDLLHDIDTCAFVTLSLGEWRTHGSTLLEDDHASKTLFLFDRDFGREAEHAQNEGFNLVREVQTKGVGFCGLITHTVPLGGEYEAWDALAEEQGLERDTFVVIAKKRLTGDSPDHYGFLRMLRLAALSGRCAAVKSAAWTVFQESIAEARATVERLSVLDFDQIILASSRREGVWEPDTLFRVFGILMRREARQRLYEDPIVNMRAVAAEARRVSGIPAQVVAALGEEQPSREALRIQRFETYESDDELSRYCLPIELGDIFEKSNGKRYILLAQPCDLMVRSNGKRSYDDRNGRSGALVELLVAPEGAPVKESWAEVPFYDTDTGAPAYADFARAHQVRLAVLDLCAFREGGAAEIEVGGPCPQLVVEPWQQRYEHVQKLFEVALERYREIESKGVKDELKVLALPIASATIRFAASVADNLIRYDLKRVIRLRQPLSGALLTAFAQYQARAAFEHPFDHRLPIPKEEGDAGEDLGAEQEE